MVKMLHHYKASHILQIQLEKSQLDGFLVETLEKLNWYGNGEDLKNDNQQESDDGQPTCTTSDSSTPQLISLDLHAPTASHANSFYGPWYESNQQSVWQVNTQVSSVSWS